MTSKQPSSPVPPLSRRGFLKLIGLSSLSVLLTQCKLLPPDASPAAPTFPATPSAFTTPSPVPTAAPSITPTATQSYRSMVAIGQADSYDPARLRVELEHKLAGIGGLADLVKPGAHVGIKPNLTGGTWWDAGLPVPATELFATHPALIGVLAAMLFEAGAGKVTILEGLGDARIFSQWGYADMARSAGTDLIDLCSPAPYSAFKIFPVQPKFNIYDSFYLNPILAELDLFISVAKMKCHATTGVTLSMKNLFGIAPIGFYRRHQEDDNRSSFHDTNAFDRRVPRVILDLNAARPIHLAIIDGIRTGEAGAGPWDKGLSPVQPGLLVASRDPVAADAVATAIMGFDPAGAPGTRPFTGGDNHIALAREAGLGTNRLAEIGIFGPPIEAVRFPFKTVG